MNNNYVFERVEKKYLISDKKLNLLIKHIEPYMTIDKYGIHTICNIYYDTDIYDLIRNSIEKPSYKEKLRLRSYGIPNKNDEVFLELKKKYDNTVFKRRISLTLKEAEAYLENGIRPRKDGQILREIDYFINFYKPEKKIFIAYDRIALFGNEDANLRITLDMNIRSRIHNLDLSKGDYGKNIDNFNNYLMEIKTPCTLPLWLVNILSELEIYPVSFSKYGSIYKQDLAKERFNQIIYSIESEKFMTEWRNIKCLQVS